METIEWKITKDKKETPWPIIGTLSLLSVLISAYFIWTQNYFGGIFFVMAPVVLVLSLTLGRREFFCKLELGALTINGKAYPLKNLAYFSFIDNNLVIKPKEDEAQYIPVRPEDMDAIYDILTAAQVKEEEHEESLNEAINRFLQLH